jgi:hypothetical protein
MTAEETLSKHIEWFTSWDIIIEAMEQYAQQQCQKQLRKELIKFIEWFNQKYDEYLEIDLAREYLKQKGLPL